MERCRIPLRSPVSRRTQHVSPDPQAGCAGCHTGKAEFGQQRCWWWELCVREQLCCAPVYLRILSGLLVPALLAAPGPAGWWFLGGRSSQLDLRGLQWLLCGNTSGRTQTLSDPTAALGRSRSPARVRREQPRSWAMGGCGRGWWQCPGAGLGA